MNSTSILQGKSFAEVFPLNGIGSAAIIFVTLAMFTLPLPPAILDLLFTFNIIIAILIMMVCINVERPFDFAAFPSILLVITLLRLSLNVASTRLILLEGHQPNATGYVIESFGQFVMGGDIVVGMIVFIIFIVINFVVVTKGAGRVSEVSARFVLDAMPGKQMAIDADLGAGAIDQAQAQQRRESLSTEMNFYGAMDGASKFVRGDAIAGIIIIFINVIGGILIGTLRHGMSGGDALENYMILTLGDGLAGQIPALILSVATAVIITRNSNQTPLGSQIKQQILGNKSPLLISLAMVSVLGLVPGLPSIFTIVGIIGFGLYLYSLKRANATLDSAETIKPSTDVSQKSQTKEFSIDELEFSVPIVLSVGFRLIPLIDERRNGELIPKIKGLRKQLSQQFGMLIPAINIRNNSEQDVSSYHIDIFNDNVGKGVLYTDRLLALGNDEVLALPHGIKTNEPAFGFPAIWIQKKDKQQAESVGGFLNDPSTVLLTHLNKLLQENAYKFIGHESVQQLLDKLKVTHKVLVETVVPDVISLATLVKVLRNLIKEQVPIRNLAEILEVLAESAAKTNDSEMLTLLIREALAATIIAPLLSDKKELNVISFGSEMEQVVMQAKQNSNAADKLLLEPTLMQNIVSSINDYDKQFEAHGLSLVLLVAPLLRASLSRLLKASVPKLVVISYNEVPDHTTLKVVARVGR